MKRTDRLAFKFYRSYFDAYELCETVEEKAEFMDALLNKQFLFEEPNFDEMSRMVKVIYIGQKHSIDKSVDGYCHKTNTPKEDPTKGSKEGTSQGSKEGTSEGSKEDPMVRYRSETPVTTEGSSEGSRVQEQEQGQEKGKEQLQLQQKEQLQKELQRKKTFEKIISTEHLVEHLIK